MDDIDITSMVALAPKRKREWTDCKRCGQMYRGEECPWCADKMYGTLKKGWFLG